MSRFNELANYLENLFGNKFSVKYYANKSVEWDKVIVDDEMTYGSLKVIGGQNQSLKGVSSVIEEVVLTLMIPNDSYAEITDTVDHMFQSIDKSLLLLGEDYSQFNYSYRQDLGEVIYNASIRSSVSYYFSLTTFTDLLLGDDQWLSILIGGDYVKLLGTTGITYQLQQSFDGAVKANAIQKNYIASINESIVFNGLVVANDSARAYVRTHKSDKTTFYLRFFDGENTESITAELVSYTIIGVVGSLIKFELRFIQKG